MQLRGFWLLMTVKTPTPMPTRYYQKELPDTPVQVLGRPLTFDLMQTEDPALIAELENCIRGQRGGIIPLTKEQYDEEVKKKANGTSSASNLRPRLQRQGLSAFNRRELPVAAAASRLAAPQIPVGKNDSPVSGRPMPDPIEVPSPEAFKGAFKKPPTGKMSEIKSTATAK